MKLPDRVKLPMKFDRSLLQKDLHLIEQHEWMYHFVKQNYRGNWSVIPLRGPAHATHPVMMMYSDHTCTDWAYTPFMQGCDYFREVLDQFECPLQAIRLMRLTPGSKIKEHTDYDLDFELGNARLHIPLSTNDRVHFMLNGTRVVMETGTCWYLRLTDPHSVENLGLSDRVHMVVDAQVNDWLNKKIRDGINSQTA